MLGRGPVPDRTTTGAERSVPVGKRSGVSMAKRQKETARLQRQRDKEERRKAAREAGPSQRNAAPGEDPDIAGIVPGPQPVAPEMADPLAPGSED